MKYILSKRGRQAPVVYWNDDTKTWKPNIRHATTFNQTKAKKKRRELQQSCIIHISIEQKTQGGNASTKKSMGGYSYRV